MIARQPAARAGSRPKPRTAQLLHSGLEPSKSTGEVPIETVAHVPYDCSRQGRARKLASDLINTRVKIPRKFSD
jgi:hypothetical protein